MGSVNPPTPVPPAAVYTKPNVGGLTGGLPWVGGIPDAAWSKTDRSRPKTPNCYRESKDAIKNYNKRTEGATDKLKADDASYSIDSFADDLYRHMEKHGMDSVFYVPTPDSTTGAMLNLFTHHSLVTIDQVKDHVDDLKASSTYDDYDDDNLAESAAYLTDSIDAKLRGQIMPYCDKDVSGPELWMRIVGEVQSDSAERLEKLKEDVKKTKLVDHKGENVKMYTGAMLLKCRELQRGRQLPNNICLTLIDQLSACSVPEFKLEFMSLRRVAVSEMRMFAGKDQDAIAKMSKKNGWMTYERILEDANRSFASLSDTNKWGPDVTNKDKQAAPESYLTESEANTMVQKAITKAKEEFRGGGGQDKDIECFKCGKKGHRRADCRSGSKEVAAWKTKPPSSGQPESKHVDAKEWHWCAKCSHWRISHGTEDHKDLQGSRGSAEANVVETTDSTTAGEGNIAEDDNFGGLHSSGWTCTPSHDWHADVEREEVDTSSTIDCRLWSQVMRMLVFLANDTRLCGVLCALMLVVGFVRSICELARKFWEIWWALMMLALLCGTQLLYPGLWVYGLVRPSTKNHRRPYRHPLPRTPRRGRLEVYPVAMGLLSFVQLSMWMTNMMLHDVWTTFGQDKALKRWASITGSCTLDPVESRLTMKDRKPLDLPSAFNGSNCTYKPHSPTRNCKNKYWHSARLIAMCVVAVKAIDDPRFYGPPPTTKALDMMPDFDYGRSDLWTSEQTKSTIQATTHDECCAHAHVHENVTKVASAMTIEGNNSKAEVIWDTGATMCVTPHLGDFATTPRKTPDTHVLKGIAKGLSISAVGEIKWTFTTDDGTPYDVLAPAYHVPESDRRLLSPQAFLQKEYRSNGTAMEACQNWEGLYLNCPDGRRVSIPYNERNNLPTLLISTQPSTDELDAELSLCVLDEVNQNLTEGQKELLRWHYRFGHTNFANIQRLLKSGGLGHSPLQKAASRCAHPKCASCQYGKARRRPATPPVHHKIEAPSIKSDDLFPGKKVSMDHFVVKERGRLFESKGKTPPASMYSGGCLFYDHASGHIHVEFQVRLLATETIQAKQSYERQQFDKGIVVHTYHTDNGTFNAKAFTKELYDKQQSITFSGSGAHHQNGVAE
jgi:hypothetical protein